MLQPFQWGPSGQQLTPQEVEQLRAMSQAAAARGSDTSPVGSFAGGLARLVDAFGGYKGNMRADAQAASGRQSAQDVVSALLGGQMGMGGGASLAPSTPAPASPVAGAFAGAADASGQMPLPSAPQQSGGIAGYIREGLMKRGLPQHVADGFVMNFQDESGLNPGINEQNPTVEGSSGGFGLAQWTGPRRRQLEAFAQQSGKPVSDPDLQMDFLVSELQGSERGAAAKILAAQDAGQAGAAIVNSFLRPAEEHRARREAEYLGGSAPAMGGGASIVGQGGISPVAALLAQAQGNPWVMQEYGPVIGALMQQDMSRQQALQQQQFSRENAAYEQQMRQSDPMYQAQLRQQQLQNEQMMNPQVGGNLPAGVQELQWRAQEAGLTPGTREYQDFILNGGSRSNNVPAAYAALKLQAEAAGLTEGTPEYQDFILTGGAGQRAQATAQGTVAGKARGEAVMNLPGVIATAERAIENVDAIANDPSLASITGMVQGRLPAMTQAGTDLNVRIEQAKGQVFLEAFESLKGAGQITEIEGTKAEQAIARLNRAQSTEAYQTALADLKAVLNTGVERAKRKAGVGSETAAPSATPQRRRYNPTTGSFE